MAWLADRLDRYWFSPSAPINLGVCRILFYGLLAKRYILHVEFAAWARSPSDFWQPIWFFRGLPREVFAPPIVEAVELVWWGALLLSCIGLFTRAATAASLLGGVYLLGLLQCFGKTHHFEAPVLITLGILAVSRCGDAWSVDRWLLSRRRAGEPEPSAEYTWPIRMAQVLLVLVFFGAGVSKLRRSGLEWIFSDNMKHLLLSHHYTHHPLTDWSFYLATIAWVPPLLALMTIALETGAPLALFSRNLRWIFIPGLLAMQLGIQLLTGAFAPYLLLYQFWVPWDRVIAWGRSRLSELGS